MQLKHKNFNMQPWHSLSDNPLQFYNVKNCLCLWATMNLVKMKITVYFELCILTETEYLT